MKSFATMLAVGTAVLSVFAATQIGVPRASAAGSNTAAGCTGAETAMMHGAAAMSKPSAMKPSGNLDKDYANMMSDHMKAAMAMAKIEAKCGTTPNARAQAAKDLQQFQQMQSNLSAILNSN